MRSVEATRSSTMARLVSVKPATAGRHRLAPAPEAARGRGVVFRRIANSSRDFHEKRGTGRQVRVKQTARRLASISTRMAAEEPRTGPKMDQKKVRPMEILEHPLFPFPPSPTRYTSHERIGYAPMPPCPHFAIYREKEKIASLERGGVFATQEKGRRTTTCSNTHKSLLPFSTGKKPTGACEESLRTGFSREGKGVC